jgi:hypothetical protein
MVVCAVDVIGIRIELRDGDFGSGKTWESVPIHLLKLFNGTFFNSLIN